MNKLLGFFELKDSGLPAVPWKQFNENVQLDNSYLWTVRTAIDKGKDLNLPRFIGVTAAEAYRNALDLYTKFRNNGIVVYYPYFIANKSGTLYLNSNEIVIEAVKEDLWNLVTNNQKDITIIIKSDGNIIYDGNSSFLEEDEVKELLNYSNKIKNLYRDYITEGKTLLLEWSYAFDTDTSKKPIGKKYLVFYEIRTI